jgi:hypothetical protein
MTCRHMRQSQCRDGRIMAEISCCKLDELDGHSALLAEVSICWRMQLLSFIS